MNTKMEKFINFKELNVVKTGTSTSDGSAALTLTDSAAVFTQVVLPNAIVWDRATARKYLVTAVTSDTVLALASIGVDTGTGIPDATSYYIYMPEYTVRQAGTADGTVAFGLDDSTVNFISAGVKVGDYALDITAGVTAKVTAVGATVLTVDTDTFVGGDTYLVYALGADDSEVIMRSADVVDVSNAAADSSIVNLTYGIAGTNVMKIDYAYSSTVGSNSAMRAAIQDAVVASLQTSWPNVTYDFPGLQNVYASGSNATWLGGKEYFFLKIAKS
jgi:hypothetical protein|tara:strand:- start:4462 stop:5283 length:822 start_codon:yes stop_codon:yes gene_type:complete